MEEEEKEKEEEGEVVSPSYYFNLKETAHSSLFKEKKKVWDVFEEIPQHISSFVKEKNKKKKKNFRTPDQFPKDFFHSSVLFESPHLVYIGENVVISSNVLIQGPCLICDNTNIRQGALIRTNTILASGSVVGHSSEIKSSILLEGAAAPHFAYVGDSILGRNSNLGAGVKLSNFPFPLPTPEKETSSTSIAIPFNRKKIDTGLKKFGSVIGDDVQMGCNSVASPGTLIGPKTWIYPTVFLRKGFYPANCVIKLRQELEIVELKMK